MPITTDGELWYTVTTGGINVGTIYNTATVEQDGSTWVSIFDEPAKPVKLDDEEVI